MAQYKPVLKGKNNKQGQNAPAQSRQAPKTQVQQHKKPSGKK